MDWLRLDTPSSSLFRAMISSPLVVHTVRHIDNAYRSIDGMRSARCTDEPEPLIEENFTMSAVRHSVVDQQFRHNRGGLIRAEADDFADAADVPGILREPAGG